MAAADRPRDFGSAGRSSFILCSGGPPGSNDATSPAEGLLHSVHSRPKLAHRIAVQELTGRVVRVSIVEEYWQGVAQRLQVEADVFNRLIEHNAEQGRENEASLMEVVRRLLPPSVGVGTGIVIDSDGRRSQQCDLIVFDQNASPNMLAQTSQMLFPVETVRLVIEVKTTVNKAEIDDVAAKIETLRALEWEGKVNALPTALFGYSCGNAAGTVVSELLALGADRMPRTTCVMRPGIFGQSMPNPKAGLVALHELNDDGVPISQRWVEPKGEGQAVTIGNSSFPITRIKAYGKEKVVGNPGRALLLFCAEMLGILSESAGVDANWLHRYLSATATELIDPEDS